MAIEQHQIFVTPDRCFVHIKYLEDQVTSEPKILHINAKSLADNGHEFAIQVAAR